VQRSLTCTPEPQLAGAVIYSNDEEQDGEWLAAWGKKPDSWWI
jgi:hypothetical protein